MYLKKIKKKKVNRNNRSERPTVTSQRPSKRPRLSMSQITNIMFAVRPKKGLEFDLPKTPIPVKKIIKKKKSRLLTKFQLPQARCVR